MGKFGIETFSSPHFLIISIAARWVAVETLDRIGIVSSKWIHRARTDIFISCFWTSDLDSHGTDTFLDTGFDRIRFSLILSYLPSVACVCWFYVLLEIV